MSKMNDARLTSVPENGPELAAQRRLHQHVDILPVLEGFVQPATWNITVQYSTVQPATWNITVQYSTVEPATWNCTVLYYTVL